MDKIYFSHDYETGCHPNILKALVDTNLVQTVGYGEEEYSQEAISLIKKSCENEDISVFLLTGGTQTNKIFLSKVLENHQGIISASAGHIATHESGAIENGGHKVLTLANNNEGKIEVSQIDVYCNEHFSSDIAHHLVQPGGVYLSHPTESGALYSKKELKEISECCKKYGLFLYVDGARLGYALSSSVNDITLKDLSEYTDAFYIGGTKCGALLGEALVVSNKAFAKDFKYSIKQNGALLAKGRLLGLQFRELFKNNLYVDICRQANLYAKEIAEAFVSKGYSLFCESFTNQQFIIMDNDTLNRLQKKYVFTFWEKYSDTESIIRICTSWSTTREMVDSLISDI